MYSYAWNIETKSNHERERVFDGRSRPKGTGHVTMRRVAQAALPLPINGLCHVLAGCVGHASVHAIAAPVLGVPEVSRCAEEQH